MSRSEWTVSGIIALIVALVTMAVTTFPRAWAEGENVRVTIPSLPSTTLTIPEINAQISASTTRDVGKQVTITLKGTLPEKSTVKEIPVTITIFKTVENPMSRMGPRPQQIAQQSVNMVVSDNAQFIMNVNLPLYWAEPIVAEKKIVPENVNQVEQPISLTTTTTSYSMQLTSTLGGEAASAGLRNLATK